MIIRNERSNIERSLRSVVRSCQHVVVLDTGSTDGSDTIAIRQGAELHYYAWSDSFSEARNQSIRFARSPWILQIDADEELVQPSDLASVIASAPETAGAFTVTIGSTVPDGSMVYHSYPRLFRRHAHIKYEGRIHEQIGPSVRSLGLSIEESSVKIYHWGYEQADSARTARNLALLDASLAETPAANFLLYHKGQTLFAAGQRAEAWDVLASIVGATDLTEDQQELTLLRLGQLALHNGRRDAVLGHLSRPFANTNYEGFRLYLLGVFALESGNVSQARVLMERALATPSTFLTQQMRDLAGSVSEASL